MEVVTKSDLSPAHHRAICAGCHLITLYLSLVAEGLQLDNVQGRCDSAGLNSQGVWNSILKSKISKEKKKISKQNILMLQSCWFQLHSFSSFVLYDIITSSAICLSLWISSSFLLAFTTNAVRIRKQHKLGFLPPLLHVLI